MATTVTLPATNIGHYHFSMNMSFDPSPGNSCGFEYKIGIDGNIVNKYLGHAHSSPLTYYIYSGVYPNTLYYYRGYANEVYGEWVSFTTLAFTVDTNKPTDIGGETAIFHGTCSPSGFPCLVEFDWKKGIDGEVFHWGGGPVESGPFSHAVTGLLPNEIYYVRAGSQPNSSPLLYGDWVKFTTSESIAITDPATDLGNLTAKLNGQIIIGTDGVSETGFEWSRVAYTSPISTFEVVGTEPGDISKVLTGLIHNTVYYFRAWGKNDASVIFYGEWEEFTTTNLTPTVTTQIATDIEALSVTGNGTIVDCGGLESSCSKRGFDVKYSFTGSLKEYEAWKGYGFIGNIILNSETGLWSGDLTKSYEESDEFTTGVFDYILDGLVNNKTFLYRAKAKNTVGWGYGNYLEFITDELLLRKTCTIGIWTILLCAHVKPIPLGSVIKRRGFRWGIYNTAQEYDIHEDGDFSASAEIGPKTLSFVCSNDDNIYDTIVDSGAGFLTAGFVAGKFIDISATGALSIENEGQFKIISVTADTITVNVRNTLVSEAVTGVTIVDLFALYIVDLDPETIYYSVAYVAIEDSEGNWTVQEGDVASATTIVNPFDFEGYDKVEFYKPEREQNYKKITRKIEAEIISEQQYIEKAGSRRFLDIKNHLIQTKANAVIIGTNYRDRFQEIKSLMAIEYPTPAPLQREDTLDIGFGRIRFKLDDKGVVNFMPDGEGLMLFRYRMVMMIRKNDIGYTISKDNVDYMATMELEEA